ncbi:hypothetical protein, partial [Bacillus cereus group sp. Bce015]|uniref:hypothetical protein n=1 Tax=Bacillus cereus group sp. Bce015 TaxID=3445249 RepID=UPI003F1F082F
MFELIIGSTGTFGKNKKAAKKSNNKGNVITINPVKKDVKKNVVKYFCLVVLDKEIYRNPLFLSCCIILPTPIVA